MNFSQIQLFNAIIEMIQQKFSVFVCNYSTLAIKMSTAVAHISAHTKPLDMPDMTLCNLNFNYLFLILL